MIRWISVTGLCLLCLCGIQYMTSPTKPMETYLSQQAFDQSCGVEKLSHNFVFHKNIDKHIQQLAHHFIQARSRENHTSSIPHHIHHIWVHDAPIPEEKTFSYTRSLSLHPHYQHTLWQHNDFAPLLDTLVGPEWHTFSKDVVKDLAAAAILLHHGGIVMDMELEMVAPLSSLLSLADCIVALEPPLPSPVYDHKLFVCSSWVASVDHHPLIASWMQTMINRSSVSSDALWITQDSLCESVLSISPTSRCLIVAPTIFCPITPTHIQPFLQYLDGKRSLSVRYKIARFFGKVPPFSTLTPDSLAFHTQGGRLHMAHPYVKCTIARDEAQTTTMETPPILEEQQMRQ